MTLNTHSRNDDIPILSACNKDNSMQKDIVGTWEQTNAKGTPVVVTFNDDHTFRWQVGSQSERGNFSIHNSILTLSDNTTKITFGIQKLKSSTLIIHSNSSKITYEFAKE